MWLLAACRPADPDTGRAPPAYATPTLTAASAECFEAEAFWRFEASANGWTGNGAVYLSADGAYLERHAMYSREAAYDGTSDSLRLELTMVADFRDVTLGTSTVFGCAAADLAGLIEIYERDGRTAAGCRVFGVEPERWATWLEGADCPALEE